MTVAVQPVPENVIVPVRELGISFGAAVTWTLPLPVPLAGLTVSQPALLCTVQVHPLPAVTYTVWVPPHFSKLRDDGLIEYVQHGGWLTVSVAVQFVPENVIVPLRVPPVVFEAA